MQIFHQTIILGTFFMTREFLFISSQFVKTVVSSPVLFMHSPFSHLNITQVSAFLSHFYKLIDLIEQSIYQINCTSDNQSKVLFIFCSQPHTPPLAGLSSSNGIVDSFSGIGLTVRISVSGLSS